MHLSEGKYLHLLIKISINHSLRWMDCWSSNELKRLHYLTGDQDSCPSIDTARVTRPIGCNRIVIHIPQFTSPISHNAPLCNRNVHTCTHFCYKVVHCGIFVWCIVGFVGWLYCHSKHVPLKMWTSQWFGSIGTNGQLTLSMLAAATWWK